MAKDDLYIGQLEQALTNLEMGEHESATSYCNRAKQILVNLRMAGVDYSQSSYINHVVKGLPQQYNLLRRMLKLPQTSFPSPPTTAQQQQPKNGGGAGGGGEKWKGGKDGHPKGGKGGFKGKCYVCGQTGHVAKYCQQRADKEADAGGEGSGGSNGKGGDGSKGSGQSSCAMVKPVVEQTPLVVLEPEAGEGLQAVAAAVKANPSVVLLDSGCSHHLMGDRSAFVEMSSGGSIKQVTGFNGALQEVQGGVQLLDARDQEGETVALRTLATGVRSKGDLWHARMAHVGIDAIERTAAHGLVKGLDLEKGGKSGIPCVSCVGGKITCHTFPSMGEEEDELLGVVHADLCGPFREAAKDGSRYFLVLKDRKTRYVWAYPLAQKSDALAAFQKWLPMAERQCKTMVLALRTDRGGEFLGHDFTLFLDGKGIIHNLTCSYTPEQNGMAEREMRSIVEAAVWVRNRMEHASLPSGVTPYELAFRRKPDVSMVRVWGCMLQYMVPQSQHGGKLAPKARSGLHLGVSAASKGWTMLDLESNRLITTVEAVFYETMSLAGWKAWHQQEHGGRSMPYAPLPSLFPITLEEAEEEEEVVAPPAMPYVPTSVPTPPPPSIYPRVIPPAPPSSSSPPLASPPPLVIPSPLPPSIPPAPALPSSSSSTAPPIGEGGIEVPPSVEITDGQHLETEQLQDESSMDGVQ
ncbi:unnamed protein product [Closterium sp. NIES-54]